MDTIQRSVLEAILEAKEKRAAFQGELLKRYKLPILSFTLNIPGSEKENPILNKVHQIGRRAIEEELIKKQISIIYQGVKKSLAGITGFFSIDSDPITIKRVAVAIEENHPLGRLFDIDVINQEGIPVSRNQLGLGERSCLLCHDQPATLCRRSQSHDLGEVLEEIYRIIATYDENIG